MSKLILASGSPRRQDLLKQIHIQDFIVKPSNIDESVLLHELPRQYAMRMAQQKADVVDGTLVLSGDTVVALGRRILPKTEDKDTAYKCMKQLSGRRHTVYGGLCLKTPDMTHTAVVKTIVKFKYMSERDIQFYIDSKEWQGKAGGYAIQGLASRYISFISGSYTNVVGMDTYTVSQWLERYGY